MTPSVELAGSGERSPGPLLERGVSRSGDDDPARPKQAGGREIGVRRRQPPQHCRHGHFRPASEILVEAAACPETCSRPNASTERQRLRRLDALRTASPARPVGAVRRVGASERSVPRPVGDRERRAVEPPRGTTRRDPRHHRRSGADCQCRRCRRERSIRAFRSLTGTGIAAAVVLWVVGEGC